MLILWVASNYFWSVFKHICLIMLTDEKTTIASETINHVSRKLCIVKSMYAISKEHQEKKVHVFEWKVIIRVWPKSTNW